MKLAFAGAGTISVVHAMAAAAVEAEIVAVASRTSERATERAAQVGAQVVAFEDLPAGADAVVVCTPPDRHGADTLQALRAGAVVLVEKPLATTLAEADAIVDAGGQVIYAENLAFSPLVVATNEFLRGIGAPNFIEIRQLSPRPSWGEFLDPARGGGVDGVGCGSGAEPLFVRTDDGWRAEVDAVDGAFDRGRERKRKVAFFGLRRPQDGAVSGRLPPWSEGVDQPRLVQLSGGAHPLDAGLLPRLGEQLGFGDHPSHDCNQDPALHADGEVDAEHGEVA